MKQLMFLGVLGATVSISAFGYEADYFTRRDGFQDSALEMNQKMNEALYSVGANSRDCNEDHLHHDLIRSMGGLIVAPAENWAAHIPGNYKPHLNESIYAGLQSESTFMTFGCCSTVMRIGENIVSGDKLGHFFQTGYEMYYVVRSRSAKPIRDVRGLFTRFVSFVWESPMSGPQIEEALDRIYIPKRTLTDAEIQRWAPLMVAAASDVQESGSWGWGVTGVKSYGDMAANYGGYFFWADLTHGTKPYYICQNGRWQFSREFDWREYVTDAWDEAINCSTFSTSRFRETMKERVAALADQNHWPSRACPIVPAKCRDLVPKYGEAARYILNPACLEQSPVVPANSPVFIGM